MAAACRARGESYEVILDTANQVDHSFGNAPTARPNVQQNSQRQGGISTTPQLAKVGVTKDITKNTPRTLPLVLPPAASAALPPGCPRYFSPRNPIMMKLELTPAAAAILQDALPLTGNDRVGNDKLHRFLVDQYCTKLFTAESPAVEEPVWRYIGLEGAVQGPFTATQMPGWYKRGNLATDLDYLDLQMRGSERDVSLLCLTAIHFQPLDQLLNLVKSGRKFEPTRLMHVQQHTLPEFTMANWVQSS